MAYYVDQWGIVHTYTTMRPTPTMPEPIRLEDGRVFDVSRHGNRLFATEESAEIFGMLWRENPETAQERHAEWLKGQR